MGIIADFFSSFRRSGAQVTTDIQSVTRSGTVARPVSTWRPRTTRAIQRVRQRVATSIDRLSTSQKARFVNTEVRKIDSAIKRESRARIPSLKDIQMAGYKYGKSNPGAARLIYGSGNFGASVVKKAIPKDIGVPAGQAMFAFSDGAIHGVRNDPVKALAFVALPGVVGAGIKGAKYIPIARNIVKSEKAMKAAAYGFDIVYGHNVYTRVNAPVVSHYKDGRVLKETSKTMPDGSIQITQNIEQIPVTRKPNTSEKAERLGYIFSTEAGPMVFGAMGIQKVSKVRFKELSKKGVTTTKQTVKKLKKPSEIKKHVKEVKERRGVKKRHAEVRKKIKKSEAKAAKEKVEVLEVKKGELRLLKKTRAQLKKAEAKAKKKELAAIRKRLKKVNKDIKKASKKYKKEKAKEKEEVIEITKKGKVKKVTKTKAQIEKARIAELKKVEKKRTATAQHKAQIIKRKATIKKIQAKVDVLIAKLKVLKARLIEIYKRLSPAQRKARKARNDQIIKQIDDVIKARESVSSLKAKERAWLAQEKKIFAGQKVPAYPEKMEVKFYDKHAADLNRVNTKVAKTINFTERTIEYWKKPSVPMVDKGVKPKVSVPVKEIKPEKIALTKKIKAEWKKRDVELAKKTDQVSSSSNDLILLNKTKTQTAQASVKNIEVNLNKIDVKVKQIQRMKTGAAQKQKAKVLLKEVNKIRSDIELLIAVALAVKTVQKQLEKQKLKVILIQKQTIQQTTVTRQTNILKNIKQQIDKNRTLSILIPQSIQGAKAGVKTVTTTIQPIIQEPIPKLRTRTKIKPKPKIKIVPVIKPILLGLPKKPAKKKKKRKKKGVKEAYVRNPVPSLKAFLG